MRNSRSFGWYNRQPSVLLVITKARDSNVIETVDRIRELIPDIKRFIPTDIDISVLSDRTGTIRASVNDMQLTLLATIGLVMLVVFLFLRRAAATDRRRRHGAAGARRHLRDDVGRVGFSIDNLSLMALACSVGFVVDDAIVMIENCFRNLEKGMPPMQAALEGARQIGFTVISISVSLVAAFIPLLFMSGVVGRVFREFSVTLAFAIAVSTVVSLTLTPMICAHFVASRRARTRRWLDRARRMGVMRWLRRPAMRSTPQHSAAPSPAHAAGPGRRRRADRACSTTRRRKGYFPTDDTGLIWGGTVSAPTDIVVPGHVRAAAEGRRYRAGRSGRRRRRFLDRTSAYNASVQSRSALHQPEAAVGAQRHNDLGCQSTGCGPSSPTFPD